MQAFKAALSLAFFIVVASLLVLTLQTPGTAEFVVSVLSLVIGLALLGLVVWVMKRFSR